MGVSRSLQADRDYLSFHPDVQHIVVICRNQQFKVPVLSSEGALSCSALQARLQLIQDMAVPNAEDVGLLTTTDRPTYLAARTQLCSYDPANFVAFQTMEQALFVIVLEDVTFSSSQDLFHW